MGYEGDRETSSYGDAPLLCLLEKKDYLSVPAFYTIDNARFTKRYLILDI
jgi:hypothetical protein